MLSVVIPAFNEEKMIRLSTRKIADVLQEARIDFEIVFIDDGSKDKTAKIAEEYATEYPSDFFHVRKENGGHGSTINKGIELATGKYFKVLDGDDWIEPQGLKSIVMQMKSVDVDMIVSDRKRVYEATEKEEIDFFEGLVPGKLYDIGEACKSMGRMLFHGTFFKTSILQENQIRIDEHRFYVDNEILWFPFPYVNSIIFLI